MTTVRRATLGAVLLVLVVALAVPAVTAARVWWVARQDERTPVDVILVLGTTQYDGVPSSIFTARLEHALVLHDEGVAPAIMTVGGNRPGDRYTEAEAAARYLEDDGVPADQVDAVGKG